MLKALTTPIIPGVPDLSESAQQPCGSGQARTALQTISHCVNHFTDRFPNEHLLQGQAVRTHQSRGGAGWGG